MRLVTRVARPLLLCREPFPGLDVDRLGERFEVEIVGGATLPRLFEVDRATAIFTYRERIDEGILSRAPHLRAVANYGVGADQFDQEAMERRGVALVRPVGANAEAVADHTIGLLVALRHRMIEGDRLVRAGGFEELMGEDVFGSTLGIVGLGAIGRAVARRARAFRMDVLYHQRHAASPELEEELGARRVSLDELLRESDVVSLHCPLTSETRSLIGRRELELMGPRAVLLNLARGAVCDEAALVEALASGRIAGAGLDVFAEEPDVPEGLRRLDNVVLTPHTADATWGTRETMTAVLVDGLLASAAAFS
jgi:glyoxylate reductase